MPRKDKHQTIINQELITAVKNLALAQNTEFKLVYGNDDYLILQDIKTKDLGLFFTEPKLTTYLQAGIIFDLADSIADLPSDGLKQLAVTEDLLDEWKVQRQYNKIIANKFLVECLMLNIDLIDEYEKSFPKKILEIFKLTAYKYRALWNLTKVTFPHIKKLKTDLIFSTSKELFTDIIRTFHDSYFERLLINNYVESLSFKQNNGKEEFKHEGLSYILWVSNNLVDKNREIRLLKKHYQDCCNELKEAMKDAYSTRTKDGRLIPSYVWEDGNCYLYDKTNKPSIPRATLKMLNKT